MKRKEQSSDDKAVMEYVLHGTPVPPEVAKRVWEGSEKLTEEIRRKFGIVDLAVPLIRESRDE